MIRCIASSLCACHGGTRHMCVYMCVCMQARKMAPCIVFIDEVNMHVYISYNFFIMILAIHLLYRPWCAISPGGTGAVHACGTGVSHVISCGSPQIDAVGRARGKGGFSGGNDEREVLNVPMRSSG